MAKADIAIMVGPATAALLMVAAYPYWRRQKSVDALVAGGAKLVGAIGVGAATVATPFLVQNVQLFGSVTGPVSKGLLSSPITINGGAANIVRATASNFDIGNGTSGLSTDVARLVLGPLRHIFSLTGISLGDLHYEFSANFNPFRVVNYTLFERIDAVGADPWHVLLMAAAAVVLIVAIRRGSTHLWTTLVLAAGLTVGYLLTSAVARWSFENVRYTIPLLVAWSAVIAVALEQFPRWVGRLVMIGLVVACLPQLLDNAGRPLVPPLTLGGSYLAPYLDETNPAVAVANAAPYVTITTMVAQSSCRNVALANWVAFEYPLWVGLGHEHWTGQLNDFDVQNVTRRLEPTARPCAWITQEKSHYRTPDNGTANVQVGSLALSVEPGDARTISTPIANFTSQVHGVRVMPGGGWYLTALDQYPLMGPDGSLYVFSAADRQVQLELHLISHVPQSSPLLSGPGDQSVPTTAADGIIGADIDLRTGVNRIDLTAGASATSKTRRLILASVTVDSATRRVGSP